MGEMAASEASKQKEIEKASIARGKMAEDSAWEDRIDTAVRDEFLMEEACEYSYQHLTESEKVWYDNIKDILASFGTRVLLLDGPMDDGCGEDTIDRIFNCVMNDHPEFFYVRGYSYTRYSREGQTVGYAFTGNYELTIDEARTRKTEIETAAEMMLDNLPADADQYEKVKYVYETLIKTTEYELDAPDNQNIYSVLANHRSVCQGYAKTTQYLLNRLGMECTLVVGTVESGEKHAWNFVKIDGEYYYLDTTWGDASYLMSEKAEETGWVPEISYDYLNITSDEIEKTHHADDREILPVCTSIAANYHVRSGTYFTDYDTEQLSAVFDSAEAAGRSEVNIKCCDSNTYDRMFVMLVADRGVFKYLKDREKGITYIKNDNLFTLTFWMTNSEQM